MLARGISHLPPIGVLFAAFLGYNPMRSLVTGPVAVHLSPHTQAVLQGLAKDIAKAAEHAGQETVAVARAAAAALA